MIWIWLATGSALFLGLYDIAKKKSLDRNAVWPVLFFCTLAGAILMLPPLVITWISPAEAQRWGLRIDSLGLQDNIRLALKAGIVSLSWAFTYQALKHLPLSIAAPIRASSPLFTLFTAVLFLSESPSPLQWVGIAITLLSYWIFALAGRKEGISFHQDKWVGFMFLGTLLGAASSIYDKHLLQGLGLSAMTVQAYFNFYMLIIQGVWVLLFWLPLKQNRPRFEWRWSIPMVGLLLVIADQFYFRALHHQDALVSVVSVVRRASVVISFALGLLVLKESRRLGKVLAVMGILCGLVFMTL